MYSLFVVYKKMASLNIDQKHGYSVKFSPFNPNCLAVVSNESLGINGKGTLILLGIINSNIQELSSGLWSDRLLDVSWSKTTPNHILTASRDGSLQLWDLHHIQRIPIKTFKGHRNEVSSIEWSSNNFILSASWDKSIKLWDPQTLTCIVTYLEGLGPVNEATFSSQIPNLFASVSEDGGMKLWNTLSSVPVASFRVHDSVVFSCDWYKHNLNQIITCGGDSLIRGWDIRNNRQPIFQLKGSTQAIKRIRFSPHHCNILASASFDNKTKIWDIRHKEPIEVYDHHSGYVYGLDWNINKIGELADCSWDHSIKVFTSKTLSHQRNKI